MPWALGIFALAAAWLFYPERSERHDVPDYSPPAMRNAAKRAPYKGARLFEHLTPKNQAFVRDNYKELLRAHERRDYQGMSERARSILSLLDEYNDTRSYESIAQRGIDAVEEEKRRRLLDERMAQIRKEVQTLESAGAEVFALGFKDKKNRETMDQVLHEIFTKDPNNQMASEWKREMMRVISEENREHQRRELARLEIKGQGLLQKAKRSPASRAELYKVMDGIRSIEPNNVFVDEWKKKLLKD